jgi:hypothetical protein
MVLMLLACTPTCEDVCDKLVGECGDLGTERQGSAECQIQCEAQDRLLENWNDEQQRDAYDAEMRCLRDATCDDIAEGVCYDPALWSF